MRATVYIPARSQTDEVFKVNATEHLGRSILKIDRFLEITGLDMSVYDLTYPMELFSGGLDWNGYGWDAEIMHCEFYWFTRRGFRKACDYMREGRWPWKRSQRSNLPAVVEKTFPTEMPKPEPVPDALWTLDSREVAGMVEKEHKNLMRDVGNYVQYMLKSTELKIEPSDFFIESTYQDSTGRTLPCYLVTKKGCEMIANKLTGAKGVRFTAAYVQKFNEMERALTAPETVLPGQRSPALPSAAQEVRAQAMLLNARNRTMRTLMAAMKDERLQPIAKEVFGLTIQ